MRFSVLAIDYDGTIAEHGQLNPEVRAALGYVRKYGISVIHDREVLQLVDLAAGGYKMVTYKDERNY